MLFSLGDDDPTSKRFPAGKSHVLLRKACDSIEFPGMSSQELSLPTEKKDRLLCPSPDGSSGGVAMNIANNENVSTSGKLARMETRRRNAFWTDVSTSGHREELDLDNLRQNVSTSGHFSQNVSTSGKHPESIGILGVGGRGCLTSKRFSRREKRFDVWRNDQNLMRFGPFSYPTSKRLPKKRFDVGSIYPT